MDRIKWNVKNGQIMNKKSALLCGAFMGGLGVAFGAFGAHALKPFLAEAGRVETFELAVRYQFYHAFALLITGLLMNHFTTKLLYYSAIFFVLGIIFFSGSLYGLCFTSIPFHYVTPLGGLFFLTGWVFLAVGVYKK